MTRSILIIEDDEDIAQAIGIKLKKAGLTGTIVTTGEEGISYLMTHNKVDLVLLDLRLPKTDGFYFLEQKSKNPKISPVPVIVFTNYSQAGYTQRALGLGVKGYLIKANHSVDEIITEVKKCLEGKECSIEY